ncbi:hypothetical protein KCU65_g9937, partial [Aureobasidium melanogenum]
MVEVGAWTDVDIVTLEFEEDKDDGLWAGEDLMTLFEVDGTELDPDDERLLAVTILPVLEDDVPMLAEPEEMMLCEELLLLELNFALLLDLVVEVVLVLLDVERKILAELVKEDFRLLELIDEEVFLLLAVV